MQKATLERPRIEDLQSLEVPRPGSAAYSYCAIESLREQLSRATSESRKEKLLSRIAYHEAVIEKREKEHGIR